MNKPMNKDLIQAVKEAGANVMIANVVNIPINWILLATLIPLQWSPLAITLTTTAVFTFIALIRFVSIRLYFHNRRYQ